MMYVKILDYDAFYSEMQVRLKSMLSGYVLAHTPVFHVRSNRMHITLDDISGSHYEICLRQEYHEIALHFQSTPERSLARRQAFDPVLNQLSETLGYSVKTGKLENRGWMRIWIERPLSPLTENLLVDYTELFVRFIDATFPTLDMIYQQERVE